jgi:hypothetical protein
MTLAQSPSRHPAGGPMTKAIGWPHEGGEFPETRPHGPMMAATGSSR